MNDLNLSTDYILNIEQNVSKEFGPKSLQYSVKHSTAQDHKSRRKSGSVVCPLLSKGDQRSVECSVTCQEPGSAGNERVCIICTLLREILSVRPPVSHL